MLMRRSALAAAVVAVAVLAGCSGGGSDLELGESRVLGDAEEGIDGVTAFRVATRNLHTESIIEYRLRPPAGGGHNPVWWNCGFYDEAIPDEHVVHDLEHGAVWLAYSPDLPDADVEVIHDLVRANAKVIAAPYPDLEPGEAVVASAWARQLSLTTVDDERLAQFVDRYQDGPQAPESGASCTGSPFGEPIP